MKGAEPIGESRARAVVTCENDESVFGKTQSLQSVQQSSHNAIHLGDRVHGDSLVLFEVTRKSRFDWGKCRSGPRPVWAYTRGLKMRFRNEPLRPPFVRLFEHGRLVERVSIAG